MPCRVIVHIWALFRELPLHPPGKHTPPLREGNISMPLLDNENRISEKFFHARPRSPPPESPQALFNIELALIRVHQCPGTSTRPAGAPVATRKRLATPPVQLVLRPPIPLIPSCFWATWSSLFSVGFSAGLHGPAERIERQGRWQCARHVAAPAAIVHPRAACLAVGGAAWRVVGGSHSPPRAGMGHGSGPGRHRQGPHARPMRPAGTPSASSWRPASVSPCHPPRRSLTRMALPCVSGCRLGG